MLKKVPVQIENIFEQTVFIILMAFEEAASEENVIGNWKRIVFNSVTKS